MDERALPSAVSIERAWLVRRWLVNSENEICTGCFCLMAGLMCFVPSIGRSFEISPHFLVVDS